VEQIRIEADTIELICVILRGWSGEIAEEDFLAPGVMWVPLLG
jgi:hypothetical protein